MNKKDFLNIFQKRRYVTFLFVLILFLLATVIETGAVVRQSQKQMAKEISRFLQKSFKENQPGVAVLAVKDGKIIFRKGIGMADMELGVRIKPDMVFRIGSITKQFTAAAIMMLEEQKKLALDDEITKFLHDYPTHGHTITIHHLLNHTSGIKSMTSMPEWLKTIRNDYKVNEVIDLFKKEPMDFAPGERFLYNNSGYFLLGTIIEKASGKSYQKFIKENIFRPLGMKNSYYGGHIPIIPKRASGYRKSKTGFENADFISMTQPFSAGGLLSTVDDIYRWTMALQSGKMVSKESYQKMITPTQLNSGKTQNYGYGLSISNFHGEKVIGHGGGIPGFSTYALSVKDKEVFVAVFNNCPGMEPAPQYVAQWIAAQLTGHPVKEKIPVKLDHKILDSIVGIYQISEKDIRTVTRKGDQLYTQRTGGPQLPVYAESETQFFYKNSFTYFTIVKDKTGKVLKMIMHRPQGDEEAIKVVKKPKN